MSDERWHWVSAVVSGLGLVLFQARSPDRPAGGAVRVRRVTSVKATEDGKVAIRPSPLIGVFGEEAEVVASAVCVWALPPAGLATLCDRTWEPDRVVVATKEEAEKVASRLRLIRGDE